MNSQFQNNSAYSQGADNPVSDEDQPEPKFLYGDIPVVSKSQKMNELHAMGTLVLEGKLNPEIFKSKLSSETIRFYGIYKNFLQIYQQSELPDDLDEQARKVFKALEKYDHALQELSLYFESFDNAIIQSGLANALEAINALTESYEVFINKQSPSLTKICKECGHPNTMGTIRCHSCASIFTLAPEEIPLEFYSLKWKGKDTSFSLGAAPFPGSLIEAFDNYDKLARQEITKEKYLEDIDWIITQIELSRQKLEREQYNAPVEAIQSTGLLFDGIDHAKKALEKLRDKILWDNHENLMAEWNKLLLAVNLILDSQDVLQFLNRK